MDGKRTEEPDVEAENTGEIRVVVLEDEALYLDLLNVALNQYAGIRVAGSFSDGATCIEHAPGLQPHVALLDIELPGGENGIEVGLRLRKRLPELGIVLLSNHRDPAFISALRRGTTTGWSYLLKKSVTNVDALGRAIKGAAAGFIVLDHHLIEGSQLRKDSPLVKLTPRQREILELIAAGYTNSAIAEKLVVSVKTVENHINLLYQILEIDRNGSYLPRVLAVLEYLDQTELKKIG